MRADITPGQTSDYLGFDLVMADDLPLPSVMLAGRGYDSDHVRKTIEARNMLPVIPMRKSRKLRVGVDRSLYRLRNLVERCFNKLKNARRLTTRYDKTAESFLGFIDITSIRFWVRHLSTGPKARRPQGGWGRAARGLSPRAPRCAAVIFLLASWSGPFRYELPPLPGRHEGRALAARGSGAADQGKGRMEKVPGTGRDRGATRANAAGPHRPRPLRQGRGGAPRPALLMGEWTWTTP